MTIRDHISTIRGFIKKHRDDTIYSDERLYVLLNGAVAILNKRKADKFNALSDWNYKSFCMKLEKGKAHDCSCAPGCSVPSTMHEVPRPLQGRNGPLMKIYTLGYEEIDLVKPTQLKASTLDPILKNTLIAVIENNKIKIYNGQTDPLVPKAIIVKGLWADVTEWSSIPFCDNDGQLDTSKICYDIDNDEFPLDPDLNLFVWQEVLNQLSVPLQIKKDDTANDNEEL